MLSPSTQAVFVRFSSVIASSPLFKGIINLLILYHTITVALKSIVIVLDGWVADGSVDFFGVDPEIIMWYSFFHLKPSEWRKKK